MPVKRVAPQFCFLAFVALPLAFAVNAWAGGSDPARRVTVCVDNSFNDVADHARVIASRMFADVGVTLEWHDETRFCQAFPAQRIVISYSSHTPKQRLPGALAYSLPYEGVHIEIFYDRMLGAPDDVRTRILAHVLVHEITHLLEGNSSHSTRGVMKAHWDRQDLAEMESRPLGFTEADVIQIRNGLNAWAARVGKHALLAEGVAP